MKYCSTRCLRLEGYCLAGRSGIPLPAVGMDYSVCERYANTEAVLQYILWPSGSTVATLRAHHALNLTKSICLKSELSWGILFPHCGRLLNLWKRVFILFHLTFLIWIFTLNLTKIQWNTIESHLNWLFFTMLYFPILRHTLPVKPIWQFVKKNAVDFRGPVSRNISVVCIILYRYSNM